MHMHSISNEPGDAIYNRLPVEQMWQLGQDLFETANPGAQMVCAIIHSKRSGAFKRDSGAAT